MRSKILAFLAICLLLSVILPSTAGATQLIKLKFNEIVDKAEIIVSGKVVNIENKVINENGKTVPYTYVTLSVNEVVKGPVYGKFYTFRLAGGEIPEKNELIKYSHMPEFKTGQEVFLFLHSNNKNYYSPVVGYHQGRFNVILDQKTGIKHIYNNFGRPVTENFVAGQGTNNNSPVDYEYFKGLVKFKTKAKE